MGNINFFWQTYLNLEKEFLMLSDTILIDDTQLSVYSLKIGDLLVRAVTEIETIAKMLYENNEGDVSISEKDRFFDTVCMEHLNKKWLLEKKVVNIVSPALYLSSTELCFCPLKKANKRGTSSSDWNKAYQGVKHDRARNYKCGNIKNLMHALGALFILNLYNNDKEYLSMKDQELKDFDLRFGSSLFSVNVHKKPGINISGIYEPSSNYDECVYLEDFEEDSKNSIIQALKSVEKDRHQALCEAIMKKIKSELKQNPKLTTSGTDIQLRIAESFEELRSSLEVLTAISQTSANQLSETVKNLKYKLVLNKQQYKPINDHNN